MNQNLILDIALPVTLFLMMLSMGSTLRPTDFGLLLRRPASVMTGMLSQLLLLPLVALVLLFVLRQTPLPMPAEVYAGFVILALSPGGSTSNLFSYLAGGNVALSITLTALASLVAPLSLPLAANAILGSEGLGVGDFSLPLVDTVRKLLVITLLPVVLGMALRRLATAFCVRHERQMTRLPFLMLMLVIVGIAVQNAAQMPTFLAQTALPALLLASSALLAGYLFARLWRCTGQDARTIAIETSIQNGGTAMLVTGTILHSPAMTTAPVMYGILMLLPMFIYIAVLRRHRSGDGVVLAATG
jgi:BASS family bile acid:Na+ symporter